MSFGKKLFKKILATASLKYFLKMELLGHSTLIFKALIYQTAFQKIRASLPPTGYKIISCF